MPSSYRQDCEDAPSKNLHSIRISLGYQLESCRQDLAVQEKKVARMGAPRWRWPVVERLDELKKEEKRLAECTIWKKVSRRCIMVMIVSPSMGPIDFDFMGSS